MAIPAIKYVVEVHKKHATYWPTWFPNEQVEVGAFGELQRGILFKRLGNVDECGVSKKALEKRTPKSRGNIVFKTKRHVRLASRGRAANKIPMPHIPAGHLGARVTFDRSHTAFLAAVGVKALGLKREQLLRSELRKLLEAGEGGLLESHHVVVTDVLKAQSGHAFISTASGQAVTLHAKAAAGAAGLDLAHVEGTLHAALETDDIMAYDGDSGMTPLFKVIGFNVGKTIRGMFRALGRERNVIRIRVKSLSTRPAVDVPLIVNPLPAQQFVIAPTTAPPFSIDAIAVGPFAVRPTLLDSRALELLLPPGMRSADIAELSQAPLVGAVAGELGVDDELTVRPIDDTPAIIEPVDSEPFLVNLMPAEELNFDVSTVSTYDEMAIGEGPHDDDDPFSIDYVDFDAELESITDELELD
jgi:hypothetical protein